MRPRITVDEISVHDQTEVRYSLSYSRRLQRFLRDIDPYIRYSEDVSDVPESILAVPLLATLCPVAWIRGADIYIDKIDKSFCRSLPALHDGYAQLYPTAPFEAKSSLHYKDLVDNGSSNPDSEESRSGVLFTGGVDSTTTYLRHRDQQPHLITVRKETETRENAWKQRRRMIGAFAAEEELTTHAIETNIKSTVKKFMVNLYHRHHLNESWDRAMFLGIGYPGFTAPLAYKHGLTDIYQSADYLPHTRYPKSTQSLLVDNLRWGKTRVESDAEGLTRQDKIELLGAHFTGKEMNWEISSCDYGGDTSVSCNHCETCFHTITGFIVANYDPAAFGFEIDTGTFEEIKSHLSDREFDSDSGKLRFWLELQERADPSQVDLPYEGVTDFVAWLADATIANEWSRPLPVPRPEYEISMKRRLCIELPYPLDAWLIRWYFDRTDT
ncbi:hypothetical protein [Halalkalicoccus tibetensis]|uniref:7-cyano-7-deazaguanine synthase (Queuosine biosynthesis) n=1 Tax=Halalkalicoccus tibetensis TaxID=175632 RepID=A0ABD5VBG3_9EURY